MNKEKIKQTLKDTRFWILFFGFVFLACALFVFIYRGSINRYSQYIYYCNKIKDLSPLLAYNANSLIGYSLLAKLFGGSLNNFYWVGYSLYAIAYSVIAILGFLLIHRLSKDVSKYYQILLIPIGIMVLANPGHLLAGFESFIIPLSLALLGVNYLAFYLVSKKKELGIKHLIIFTAINLIIQVLFGSLISALLMLVLAYLLLKQYLKNKTTFNLLRFILSLVAPIIYGLMMIFVRHESGLVFAHFAFANFVKGFFCNLTSGLVGPYSETGIIPSIALVGFGVLFFVFDIFLVIIDTKQNKKLSCLSYGIILLNILILLETILNSGTDFTLFFNTFGILSSILVVLSFYTLFTNLNYLHFNKLNPDLSFFLSSAFLCLLLVISLLSYGAVANL